MYLNAVLESLNFQFPQVKNVQKDPYEIVNNGYLAQLKCKWFSQFVKIPVFKFLKFQNLLQKTPSKEQKTRTVWTIQTSNYFVSFRSSKLQTEPNNPPKVIVKNNLHSTLSPDGQTDICVVQASSFKFKIEFNNRFQVWETEFFDFNQFSSIL